MIRQATRTEIEQYEAARRKRVMQKSKGAAWRAETPMGFVELATEQGEEYEDRPIEEMTLMEAEEAGRVVEYLEAFPFAVFGLVDFGPAEDMGFS